MNGKREYYNDSAGKYIAFIYRHTNEFVAKKVKNIGLTLMQSIILIGIFRAEGSNQRLLSRELSIDTASISKSLRVLEDLGYIYKVVDEQNRRNFLIYLTDKGVAGAEESIRLEKEFWDVFLSDFSIDEIAQMQKLLAKLENNIRHFKG